MGGRSGGAAYPSGIQTESLSQSPDCASRGGIVLGAATEGTNTDAWQ